MEKLIKYDNGQWALEKAVKQFDPKIKKDVILANRKLAELGYKRGATLAGTPIDISIDGLPYWEYTHHEGDSDDVDAIHAEHIDPHLSGSTNLKPSKRTAIPSERRGPVVISGNVAYIGGDVKRH